MNVNISEQQKREKAYKLMDSLTLWNMKAFSIMDTISRDTPGLESIQELAKSGFIQSQVLRRLMLQYIMGKDAGFGWPVDAAHEIAELQAMEMIADPVFEKIESKDSPAASSK